VVLPGALSTEERLQAVANSILFNYRQLKRVVVLVDGQAPAVPGASRDGRGLALAPRLLR